MLSLVLHFVVGLMALFTVVAALQAPIPENDTTGETLIYGPLMAICVALMLLLNSVDPHGPTWRSVTRNVAAAVCGVISAYFWMASELGRHPTDFDVWGGLGLVWVLVAFYAVVAAAIVATIIVARADLQSKGTKHD